METYMIDEKGKLMRKGEHIGDVSEKGDLKLHEKHKNYQGAVARWVREKQDEEEEAQETAAAKPPATEAEKEADDVKVMQAARIAQASVSVSHKDDLAHAENTKGCPLPPKKNPQFAEKTPAYVEWLEKYYHEKFLKLFKVKGKGKRPILKQDANGIDEVVGYEECYIADRKCHLTEKGGVDAKLSEDMDWDA